MRLHRSIRSRPIRLTAVLVLSIVLPGCGGDTATETAQPDQPLNTTADELVAHINDLLSHNPIDQDGLDLLHYAETDLHRRLHRIGRNLRPFEQLQHKVFERFGAGLSEAQAASPLAPMPAATIVDRSPQRALAATTFADGQPLNLHLVQVGGRWWISGYTLERAFDSPEQAEMIASELADVDNLMQLVHAFTAAIERGEFETIEEVRAAWQARLRAE